MLAVWGSGLAACANNDMSYRISRFVGSVPQTTSEEKQRRKDLKIKRDLLFEHFLEHPMDTRLALEIKAIDDQLLEIAKPSDRKNRSGS